MDTNNELFAYENINCRVQFICHLELYYNCNKNLFIRLYTLYKKMYIYL